MKGMLVLVFAFCFLPCLAQPAAPGATAAAMAGSYVAQSTVFSARHNVAGLAFIATNQLAAGARNNYLANQLNDFYLMGAFTKDYGTMAFDVTYYGIDAYREGEAGISYARQLSSRWSLGVRLAYAYNSIPQESVMRHLVYADAGITGILGNWRLGATVQRLAQSQWQGRVAEPQPMVLRLGGGYFFDDVASGNTCITAEYYQQLGGPADVRLGLGYAPAEAVSLQVGFSTARPAVGFGVSVAFNAIRVNLAASWHQQLGLSPITDVVYAW